MSGPATAAFSFAPLGALRLALVVAREAHRVHGEYQEVFEDLNARASALQSAQHDAKMARQAHLTATRLQAERLLAQCQRLRNFAQDCGHLDEDLAMGAGPGATALPTSVDAAAWETSVLALQQESQRLYALVEQAVAANKRNEASQSSADEPVALDDVLQIYMAQRALRQELQPAQAAACQQLVSRILGRLDLDHGEAVPRELEELGLAVALAPSMERAEALAVDLRRRVQQQRERRRQSRADVQQAQNLLEAMGDDAPANVRALLEQVICLGLPLLAETLAIAQQAQAGIERLHQQAQDAVAAEVLEQSLRDLGYDVQGVENTLFVDGGTTHFQRQGWDDYFVRLRVNRQDKTLNFNVVRRRGAQESAERKRLDTLAEDRWCAEFPRLQETLSARGIRLQVQRLLGAGELPVQVVDPDSVPYLRRTQEQRFDQISSTNARSA